MANYNYDEAGNMAAYFVLTFLLIFLVPYTLVSFSVSSTRPSEYCGLVGRAAHIDLQNLRHFLAASASNASASVNRSASGSVVRSWLQNYDEGTLVPD